VFAFGVVLYEMLHKESPWECADEKQLLEKMKTEEVSFKGGVSEDLRQLIRGCLSRKPEDRPTIEQILVNPILAEESHP
jgi:serine/threonine protein kinase